MEFRFWMGPNVPIFVAGLAMLALAAWLVWLNPHHRLNRALAVFLLVRGLSNATVPLWLVDPEAGGLAFQPLWNPTNLILPFLAAYFAAVYREERHAARRRRWIPWALAAGAAALVVAWALDPGRFLTVDGIPPERSAAGPLGFVLAGVWPVTLAFIALLLARDYVQAPQGPLRTSTLLASLAFVLYPFGSAIDVVLQALAGARAEITSGVSYRLEPAAVAANAAALVVCLVTAVVLVVHARRAHDPGTRFTIRRYLVVLLVPALAAALLMDALAVGLIDERARGSTSTGLIGVWLLAQPLILTYALFRHQLFGVDLRIRWTIKQSTVAALFIAVFFIASELAQEVFSDRVGPFLGIAAAGALLFAIAPLQRVAERVAHTALPAAKAPSEMDRGERIRVYRDMVVSAWRDGRLDPSERSMLVDLRKRLGIGAEEAEALEAGVTSEMPSR